MTGPGSVFFSVLALSAAGGAAGVIRSRRRTSVSAGVVANERISAVTGALLLPLVAAVGVTILHIGDLLPEHYLVGFFMLGPLGLKLGSTGYRFLRYYTGDPTYRQAGPPQLLMRLVAPLLVLTTGAVFVTGIELWLFGYRFGAWWYQAHIVSFLVWTLSLAMHLVVYARRSVQAAWDDIAVGPERVFTRRGLVVASLILGAVMAAASLLYSSPFQLPGGSG